MDEPGSANFQPRATNRKTRPFDRLRAIPSDVEKRTASREPRTALCLIGRSHRSYWRASRRACDARGNRRAQRIRLRPADGIVADRESGPAQGKIVRRSSRVARVVDGGFRIADSGSRTTGHGPRYDFTLAPDDSAGTIDG